MTPQEQEENKDHLTTAILLSHTEMLKSAALPINDEYCWMHDGPGYGGWSCQHPECRKEETKQE